jgi:hypothetical protein
LLPSAKAEGSHLAPGWGSVFPTKDQLAQKSIFSHLPVTELIPDCIEHHCHGQVWWLTAASSEFVKFDIF